MIQGWMVKVKKYDRYKAWNKERYSNNIRWLKPWFPVQKRESMNNYKENWRTN